MPDDWKNVILWFRKQAFSSLRHLKSKNYRQCMRNKKRTNYRDWHKAFKAMKSDCFGKMVFCLSVQSYTKALYNLFLPQYTFQPLNLH